MMSTITDIDPRLKNFILKKLVHESLTYEQLSMVLQQMYPGYRGFSVRSLQRYCASENIRKTSRLKDTEMHHAVQESVLQVIIVARGSYSNIFIMCIIIYYVETHIMSI